jgi:hypothetical protein
MGTRIGDRRGIDLDSFTNLEHPSVFSHIAITRLRWMAAGVTLLIAAMVTYWLAATPSGPRTLRQFDPARMADLELRMWQAYYAKERVRLFGLLVTMLHEQHHYSWMTATREGFHLARAAATFGDARANYESVLPDLEKAYEIARNWLHAGFDPRAVARAELAWWVARRTPGQDSPERVGGLMAEAYARLYEVSREPVTTAALLRARAAALRDTEAEAPNWAAVGHLLRESYRDLHLALANGGVK